jgi:hypothetical protein
MADEMQGRCAAAGEAQAGQALCHAVQRVDQPRGTSMAGSCCGGPAGNGGNRGWRAAAQAAVPTVQR